MQQQQPESSSRLGLRNTGGVIVEVQGGHIVRSTGRKDRHSKVCTAKGPRDRRVRLSAHTAIQFYDVQDRLGYDRPSKAVDWLIKKAKASIDELAELPAWNPTTGSISTNTLTAAISSAQQEQQEQQLQIHERVTMAAGSENASDYAIQHHRHQQGQMESAGAPQQSNTNNQSFLPPSLDSDSIADTIKSFFPMGASAEASSNAMHFQNYPPDLLSRTSSHSQDLRLSLQSFQDPMLIQSHHHHHHQHQGQTHHHQGEEHGMFSGTNPLGFDSASAGWAEHHQPAEIGRFQRMIAWNAGADTGNGSGNDGGGGGGGFMFNSPPSPPQQQQQQHQPFLQQLFGQSQFFSQRGPLQSSNTSSIRAWIDSPMTDHHQHHHQSNSIHPSTMSGIGGYASGDFSAGFRIPARIQGEEEHDDGISNKPPSSASSDSRH